MCFSNPKAVALLWQRFVRYLREACWDTGRLLPRMASPTPPASSPPSRHDASTPSGGADQDMRGSGLPRPDFGCCLLHQKLQMLNLCIQQAHKLQPQPSSLPATSKVVNMVYACSTPPPNPASCTVFFFFPCCSKFAFLCIYMFASCGACLSICLKHVTERSADWYKDLLCRTISARVGQSLSRLH